MNKTPIIAAIGTLNQDITQCEYRNSEMSGSRQAISPGHALCAELGDQVQGSAKIDRWYQYLQCNVPAAADQGHEHETQGPGSHPQHVTEQLEWHEIPHRQELCREYDPHHPIAQDKYRQRSGSCYPHRLRESLH